MVVIQGWTCFRDIMGTFYSKAFCKMLLFNRCRNLPLQILSNIAILHLILSFIYPIFYCWSDSFLGALWRSVCMEYIESSRSLMWCSVSVMHFPNFGAICLIKDKSISTISFLLVSVVWHSWMAAIICSSAGSFVACGWPWGALCKISSGS